MGSEFVVESNSALSAGSVLGILVDSESTHSEMAGCFQLAILQSVDENFQNVQTRNESLAKLSLTLKPVTFTNKHNFQVLR